MLLSPLQIAILEALAKQSARDHSKRDGHFSISGLVCAYYGPLSRKKQRKKYQSAFAATSRAIVSLENRGLVERCVRQRWGRNWFLLLPAGREALKTKDG